MKFEQFPQARPEEPAKPSKKKGLAILGLVGALAGGFESTAQADTKKREKGTIEKEGKDLARLKQEADARWSVADRGMKKIETRSEGRGPDGRVVLFYGGTDDVNGAGDLEHVRGYSILDQGDPAKTGDERWIDVRRGEYVGGKTDPQYSTSLDVRGAGAELIMDTPFGHELKGKAAPAEGSDAELFLHLANQAYWEFYAAKVSGQDAKVVKKAFRGVLTYGSEFLSMVTPGGNDFQDGKRLHEEAKARANAELKVIEDFKPNAISR